jgi:hypothetical protein
MATAYSAPEGFDPPPFSMDTWQQDEQDYLNRLADRCKMNGTNPLLGETIHFPRGDGAATYMVWKTKPLQLIHVAIGDAWQVEDALIRGLRLSDVRDQVEGEARMRALFSKGSES